VVGILQGSGSQLFGSLPSQTNILLDNIRANVSERFQAEQKVIQDTATARTEAIDAESERYISVKAQINNAKIAVEGGQESIASIRNTLLAMRTTVALAGENGEDPEFRAGEFDNQFNSINSEANSGGALFNLTGNINRIDFSPNSIEYRNDLGIGQTTLTGTHAGSDYRIRAADGSYWIPELGTDTITHRSDVQGVVQKTTLSDGTVIDKTASTRNAVELVSYDETTGAITLEVTFDPGLPAETVSGTLQRDGIGLMPSWFYKGLAAQGDRTRAFKAIEKAEIELTSKEAVLSAAQAQVARDERKIDEAMEGLTKDKSKALNDQLKQSEELQIKAQQQLQAMEYNLQNLSAQQQNYLQAFGGAIRSPFLQISIRA
jgi:hypothetical protein